VQVEGPEFSLSFRRSRGRVVVDVRGALDLHAAAQLRHRLVDLIDGQGNRQFVLDLQEMTLIDSRGLSVLVDAHKRIHRNAGDLVLSGVTPDVARAFKVAGLDKVFTFTPAWEHPAYGDGQVLPTSGSVPA
jgi:anti-anti-sigma factor